MTIATRGQGVAVDPPDGQLTTHGSQPQIVPPVSMGTMQLSPETGVVGSNDSLPLDQQQPPPLPSPQQILPQHQIQLPAELIASEDGSIPEPDFPHAKLAMLEEKISSPRWVVPVLPEQELEVLLNASIDLCRKGLDVHSEACQRFFREGLTVSFTKILTDEAVNSWKFNIHHCIYQNCERLVELCVVKLSQDWFPLLDLLAMVFNPNNKFHAFNSSRQSETVPPGSNIPEEELFARPPPDSRACRGWLVDLINRFGNLGGFQILLERFQSGKNLTVTVIYALIRPFGLCYEFLTVHTITKYLMPIVEMIPGILDNLTDDELKKEAKNESKNDAISAIIKAAKCLVSRVPNQEEMIKNLEIFRLKMILRLLQISSFNGKMNALNEVNKVIASVTYYPHRHTGLEEEEWLTAERMAKWIKENKVLQIVLRDSLHQPQYVEKLEKILRFVIKERALTLEDLDNVWAAQAGKHEAIVKNVHDLLAKLAWDFSPEQLDHLFVCFQSSWTNANKKQREKLLELIRRLAEDDKDGVMAHKVLTLFWNLAHSDDVPTEIMDQALTAHVKILDYSCSQERDAQKTVWLDKCVEELKTGDKWALPALKQIREICCLYEPSPNMNHSQRGHHMYYRQEVIERLQSQHSLVILVTNSLTTYMEKIRNTVKENPDIDPNNYYPDGRYNHNQQVQERLNFLRFLLKDGQLWLCADQAKQIWKCLAEEAVFPSDREACFKWFSKLMGEEPDLDPAINKEFFEHNILQLDPSLLTESGMKCFERFFKAVNSKEGKLKTKRRAFLMDDVDLIGIEYLWRVVTNSADEIANRAIELLKEVNTNLGPRLQGSLVDFHETYISECLDRLKAHYDTVSILLRDDVGCSNNENVLQNVGNRFSEFSVDEVKKDEMLDEAMVMRLRGEAVKMCRVMKVLQEYIGECDGDFSVERKILPLHRACRGKHLSLLVRFSNPGRPVDDIDIFTHSNDTLASLRRQILRRIKASGTNVKLDLFINGELLDPADDRKLLSQIPLRDKMLLSAKLCQVNSNMPSSPDSSSDSSTSSPQHPYDGPNLEAENILPGVLMSQRPHCAQFFFQLADLGCRLQYPPLRDGARTLLKLIPPDVYTEECLQALFQSHAHGETSCPSATVDNMFFASSPSQVLYNLEVMYALLMPALDPMSEKAFEFQYNFMRSGDAPVILEMLTKNNFLANADVATKRSAYLTVLKMSKLLLSVVGHVIVRVRDDPPPTSEMTDYVVPETNSSTVNLNNHSNANTISHNPMSVLRQALLNIPNQNTEYMLRSVAAKVAQSLAKEMVLSDDSDRSRLMFLQALQWDLPDINTIRAVVRLAWAASSGSLHLLNASPEELHQMHDKMSTKVPDTEDVLVCKEALEVLTIALVLNPKALENFTRERMWHTFIIDLVLLCKNRSVRLSAAEQFLMMSTWCSGGQQPLQFCISLLFSVLNNIVVENARNSHEYFQLLCRLVNCAFISGCPVPNAETLLNNEISWLKKIRENVKETGETFVDEAVLEGHLGIAKELLSFMPSDKKYEIGSEEKKSINLIKELVEDFVFPASHLMLHLQKTGELCADQAIPVCSTPLTTNAAFDLLVALCIACVPNMKLLVEMLTEMFYSERDEPLVEWDYLPPVGPRPPKGFVGLKNAGATCYMNSVLQQLYMVQSIRVGILASEGAAIDLNEDFSGEERLEGEGTLEPTENDCNDEKCGIEESRKEYNIGILKQVQAIFGHLAYSKLQYYVPRGLWKHFKLQGEPVNLREQQDAVEFFMSLVESIDEALKALNQEQIMGKILGGSYSDQKICKGCPHRYSKEEPFSVISVDIRNHSNLLDSLEQYVKGELLEGADAYHCEKCNKKVVTVKRLCVKKLPPILAIQLKRFEYDFERVCAIKFNDYFEFPRDLDMEPYTVSGLAKLEGEMIDYEEISKDLCTKYQLSGIVVHSGQASGGHYYSYILHKQNDGTSKWYKFDDGEVSECKMDDDEEMKTQCFGGDYMGEVFDHMLKRMSYRRQKRWWNAYMLFYTRLDVEENLLVKSFNELSLSDSKHGILKMPPAIERSVRKQNIKFMHNRNQFSAEYFQFIRKLVSCNSTPLNRQHNTDKLSPEGEELAMLSVQLASRFLFHTGFHTKKTLRGPASEWYEVLCHHLQASKHVRWWFAHNVLFQHPHRFCEYLLSCPSTEVRSAFMKIIVFLAHFSLQDGPCAPPMLDAPSILLDPHATLSDHLLHAVLLLLHKEVSDHGRHLPHYFSLFHMYASLGIPERTQLLKLNVPATFMLVALDEGPGPPIKYQYPELTKLHQVVSQLIRCCDVSKKCQSSQSQQGVLPLPNPYGDPACPDYIMPIQPQAAEILFGRTSYIKKVIEDANLSEETVKLLQFCCWENPHFSRIVLSELLWQIAYAYCHELRHHMDLLLSMLLMEDSWQTHRIHNALKGVPEEREGLFDTIQRSKNHYQKRAYQCIKCMVALFSKCRAALQMLHTNGELKRKWALAVEWLQDELERRPYPPNAQYSYNNWSPPAQSNESTNGYYLERSNSARKTLERACELCPEEEQEMEEMSEEGDSPQPEEQHQQPPQNAPFTPAYSISSPLTSQRFINRRALGTRMITTNPSSSSMQPPVEQVTNEETVANLLPEHDDGPENSTTVSDEYTQPPVLDNQSSSLTDA
ncbi:probable ubiquitin carboxyl-terminal hydrolase FAF-X isoform X1 [Schistocerca gregaria]|uniref:probable ubiquitin carboxyl-terminal hydrolase FAF-X isoform X1 n=1 Tax=Schistocerca gregaria TaxID=7010 RepID=UPI00211E1CC6|nr:probable ubiquitin carboxyl-terminal hydrolase FAF-X isoform X1 [Schistocerca gregaria]XP_049853946.1 probable ubiquitin carboxyl-terminal hydrolase FAF-X isoform X1 [Schistocerca gregaria]XP_049853947.1 probable ubiquitin carboxyl-terminal hydrolase FAF-X isoform X1 [Schistocerca gregaria]